MQMTMLARKLGRSDLKVLTRDRFIIGMFFFLVYIVVVLRFGLPWVNGYLAERGILPGPAVSQSFSEFYPLVLAYLGILTGAQIVGMVLGFMLLDEKDHGTLRAMLVTPVRMSQYVTYRVILSALLGFVVIVAMMLLINQALPPSWQLLFLAAGGSLAAPIMTLFFPVVAENKVQGFAYGKFVGIAGWFILGAWFVPLPFQWLFGIFPPFWISKAYWLALEGNGLWWLALLAGIVLQLAAIILLVRRFNKVAYR